MCENSGYQIIRSRRRTLALEIGPQGVLVRAPLRAKNQDIEDFLRQHRTWIETHLKKAEERRKQEENLEPLTHEDIRVLAQKAGQVIPERVRYYAPKVGVTCGKITIRNQRTKWGSCSSAGNLNFNCLLMLTPPEVIDSVVVHELCHRKEMNHSSRFYAEVLRVYPDYRKWEKWLKENGRTLLAKMLKGEKAQKEKR